jgi:hypothetical protein
VDAQRYKKNANPKVAEFVNPKTGTRPAVLFMDVV